MIAVIPQIAPTRIAPKAYSAHTGLTAKPWLMCLRRVLIRKRTVRIEPTMASAQLAVTPIVPDAPPNMMKLGSSGEIVVPLDTHQAPPRQIKRPPKVTIKDGITR